MTTFEITVRPTEWGWKWEATWYDPESPLATAFRLGTDPYPTREAAREAAEEAVKRIAETVPETYYYDPAMQQHREQRGPGKREVP